MTIDQDVSGQLETLSSTDKPEEQPEQKPTDGIVPPPLPTKWERFKAALKRFLDWLLSLFRQR